MGSGARRGGALIGHAALRTEEGRELDENLFKALNAEHGRAADRFFAGVTELGSLYAAAAAAGALALAGRRREGARALAGAGATWLLLQGIKRGVEPAPPVPRGPRGHAPDDRGAARHVVAVQPSRGPHDVHARRRARAGDRRPRPGRAHGPGRLRRRVPRGPRRPLPERRRERAPARPGRRARLASRGLRNRRRR